MNPNLISEDKFLSNDVINIAQFLLGKHVVSQVNNKYRVGRIVETEAYRAPEDKGSHAYNNKKTARTETMFQKGGIAYIYLCYGIHNMFNIVTGSKGTAHAILIRALEPIEGIDEMINKRGTNNINNLCNGPGKLCQAMSINRKWNGTNIYSTESPIYLLDQKNIAQSEILKGPRVGIAYAEECAYWEWRFSIKNNPFVSKPTSVIYTHKKRAL